MAQSAVATGQVAKRLLLGRKLRSSQLGETLLPKRIALPVFASDALSSVAYAPDEILLVLAGGGAATAYLWSWKVALLVAVVMLTVVASYRQNVHAYPSGGGDYEVATVNIGPNAGLTVGSALMIDYVLTVAVSISSAASNIGSAVPIVAEHKVLFAIAAIVLLTAVNLRGIRESGTAFAFPTYAFIVGMLVMLAWGFARIYIFGDDVQAEDAFRRALNEGRALADVWRNLGLMLQRAGRRDEAESAYRRGIDADPGGAAAWTGLGMLLLEMGRADEARNALARAVEVDPTLPEARYHLAFALSASGDYAAALRETRQALEPDAQPA